MDIVQIITDFGFPTALLLIILWGMRSCGKFCAPLMKQGFLKHIELVDTLKSQTERQTELLEKHGNTLDDHTTTLGAIHEAVRPDVVNP